jgi:hypothetical protein
MPLKRGLKYLKSNNNYNWSAKDEIKEEVLDK